MGKSMSNKHPILRERAREMRRNPTEPEKRLWRYLSGAQLGGYKFRRQAVVGNYICDFLCATKALAIEVDGETHAMDSDLKRDQELLRLGIRVLHVTNSEVMNNMDGVLAAILAELDDVDDRWNAGPTPTPPLKERGLRNG